MAGNIRGITIEIDGKTTKLQKALGEVNKKSRDLNKELRDVEKSLKFNPGNTELLIQKQRALKESISNTKDKLNELKNAQKQAADQLKNGKIGQDEFDALRREVIKTENQLKTFEGKLKQINNIKLNQISEQFKSVGGKMTAVGQSMSTKVTAPIVGGITAITEGTRELREDFAKLDQNARDAGVGLDVSRDALERLSGISEETDSNVEAVSNLLASGFSDNELTAAVDALSGAVIKFPDTLKIEGVADGLQETLATGKAIGPFAEMLERMGVNLEDFDAGLAEATKSGDAHVYMLETLNGLGLSDITAEYRENNRALVEARETQHGLAEESATLGETLEPIMTSVKETISGLLEKFNALSPGMQDAIVKFGLVAAAVGPLVMILGTLISSVGSIIGLFAAEGALVGALTAVSGFFAAGGTAATAFGAAMAFITGPIGVAIGAITVLVAAGVALYKNWDTVKEYAAKLGEFLGETWEKMKTAVGDAFNAMGKSISETWQKVKDGTSKAWENIKSEVSEKWSGIKSAAKEKFNETKDNISTAWENTNKVTTEKWNGIKTTLGEKWQGIKEGASEKFNAVKDNIGTAWDNVSTKTGEAWGVIKGKVDEHGGGINGILGAYGEAYQTVMSGAWNAINQATGGKLGEIANAVTTKFDEIKGFIQTPIENATNFIKEQLDKIAGFFGGLTLEFPNIKMPHFSIDGEFSLAPPSVPTLGIDWYAKGGIFTRPTIFAGGIGVGEAGAEAVLPIDRLSDIFANTMHQMGMGAGTTLVVQNLNVGSVKDAENMMYEMDRLLRQKNRSAGRR